MAWRAADVFRRLMQLQAGSFVLPRLYWFQPFISSLVPLVRAETQKGFGRLIFRFYMQLNSKIRNDFAYDNCQPVVQWSRRF